MKNIAGLGNNSSNHSSKDMTKFVMALFCSLSLGRATSDSYGQSTSIVPRVVSEQSPKDTLFSQYLVSPVKRLEKHMTNCREIVEYNLIEQINILRQEKKMQPLVKNDQLTKAAQKHAEDMTKNNYFSHTSKDGSKRQERARKQGFRGLVYENIGKNYYSIQDAIEEQAKSLVHYKNITNSRITQVGIGYENGYRVIVFGE